MEQASAKSIRLTAIDNSGEVKVFLIMASPDESRQLYRHLDTRVKNELERQKHKKEADSSDIPSKRVAVDSGGN